MQVNAGGRAEIARFSWGECGFACVDNQDLSRANHLELAAADNCRRRFIDTDADKLGAIQHHGQQAIESLPFDEVLIDNGTAAKGRAPRQSASRPRRMRSSSACPVIMIVYSTAAPALVPPTAPLPQSACELLPAHRSAAALSLADFGRHQASK